MAHIRTFYALLTVSILASHAFAEAQDYWEMTDAKTHQESLCTAYVDGAKYQIHRKTCSAFGCSEWNFTVTTFCGKAADGTLTAKIEQSKNNGQIFSRETLTESNWKSIRGNLVRAKAKYAESFGLAFSLDHAEILSGNRLRVDYSVRSQSKVVEEGFWILGDGPTIPQLLERHTTQYGAFKEVNSDILVSR